MDDHHVAATCFVCNNNEHLIEIQHTSKLNHSKLNFNTIMSNIFELHLEATSYALCERCYKQVVKYDKGLTIAKMAQEQLKMMFSINKRVDKKHTYQRFQQTVEVGSSQRAETKVTCDDEILDLKSPELTQDESPCDNDDCYSNEEVVDFDTPEETQFKEECEDETIKTEVIEIEILSDEKDDQSQLPETVSPKRMLKKILGRKLGSIEKVKRSEFNCKLCGFPSDNEEQNKQHMSLHEGIDPLQCPICHKHYMKKGALVKHMDIHSGKVQYVCSLCGKSFIHYGSYYAHTLVHENLKEKKCEICGKMFYTTSHLNRHMRSHTGEKPFKCSCGVSFAQRYNLRVHEKSHLGIKVVRKKKVFVEDFITQF